MGIEWVRDLALCILGFGTTIVVIFIGIIVFLLFRKIKPVLESLKNTTRTVENISSCVEAEVATPLAQISAFIQGIRQAINMVSKFSRKREEKRNG